MMKIFAGLATLMLLGCQAQKAEVPVPAPVAPAPVAAKLSTKLSIAKLGTFVPAVDLRRSEELEWNPATANVDFYNFDSVKTAAQASASIEFNDSTSLKLKENSLVVILEKKVLPDSEESSASLKSGLAEAQILPHPTRRNELLLKTKSVWIRTSKKPGEKVKTVLQTEVKPSGEVQVTASQGQVELVSVEKTETLKQGQTATVTSPDVVDEKKPEVKITEPPHKIVIRLNKSPDAKAYFFKVLSILQKKQGGTVMAEIRAECEPSYTAYFKNKPVTNGKGGIYFKTPVKKGTNSLSLMLVNEAIKDVKYETLEVETND